MGSGKKGTFLVVLLSLVCAQLLAGVPIVRSHAILVESSPAGAHSVRGPEVPIWLRFNVRVDGKRSRLSLKNAEGKLLAVSIKEQEAPDVLSATTQPLDPGAYRLLWQVLADDGHVSRGELPFQVEGAQAGK